MTTTAFTANFTLLLTLPDPEPLKEEKFRVIPENPPGSDGSLKAELTNCPARLVQ